MGSHEALFEQFKKTMEAVAGPAANIETKSMFGGIFAWIDGAPGKGKMVGGISSKGRVQLRSTQDVKNKLKALSVKYRVGKQPCVLIKPSDFFGDAAKDLMTVGIESARNAPSKGKRKAAVAAAPSESKPKAAENGVESAKKAKIEEPAKDTVTETKATTETEAKAEAKEKEEEGKTEANGEQKE